MSVYASIYVKKKGAELSNAVCIHSICRSHPAFETLYSYAEGEDMTPISYERMIDVTDGLKDKIDELKDTINDIKDDIQDIKDLNISSVDVAKELMDAIHLNNDMLKEAEGDMRLISNEAVFMQELESEMYPDGELEIYLRIE